MHFKYPQVLWFLLLIVLPILIHFFNLRRFKPTFFTNVAFLSALRSETYKSSVLRKYLLLAMRITCLASLVLAFAQPCQKTRTLGSFQNSDIVFFLDNSFSMQAKGDRGELYKRALQDLIDFLPEKQHFTLFTNSQTFLSASKKTLENELANPTYCGEALGWQDVMLKGKSLFSENKAPKTLVLITDLQGFPNHIAKDSTYSLYVIPQIPASQKNITLEDLSLRTDFKTQTLAVRLKDHDRSSKSVSVALRNADTLISKTLASFSNGKAQVAFTISDGSFEQGSVSIEDSSLPFDNTLYFSIGPKVKNKVLSINGSTDDTFLRRIFVPDEFHYISKTPHTLDYSTAEQQDLLILNGIKTISSPLQKTLEQSISKGVRVLVIPSSDIDVASYNKVLGGAVSIKSRELSNKNITKIVFSHWLYKEVFQKEITNFDYPKTSVFFNVSHSGAVAPALYFEDSKPCLLVSKNIAFFAMPLNSKSTDFLKSPLIVPTLYNMVRQSGKTKPLYYTIGRSNRISVPINSKTEDVVELANKEHTFIPTQKRFSNTIELHTAADPKIAGVYEIMSKTNHYGYVSYNFSREESVLRKQVDTDSAMLAPKDMTGVFGRPTDEALSRLWVWLVVFSLLLIYCEGLMLKQKL